MVRFATRWFGGWGQPHLSDESLVELHTLQRTGEHALAARYQRHVRQCESCMGRLEALREDCAELRRDVLAGVDALITPARLDRQFDIIARRLEGHAGRVLPFPVVTHRPAPAPPLRRWIATAAACGLLIGVGAGRWIGPIDAGSRTAWRPSTTSPTKAGPRLQHETDEQMLDEIDYALTRSRTKEFRALDELTPRINDARARARR
ncbi:MAG TPA: hypothetical protein VMF13_21045 [Luteitalea sp.]|nr:hypothetical protein [Luteitalea sp.]